MAKEEMKSFLDLNSDVFPDLKECDVGDTYVYVIKGKLISKTEGDPYPSPFPGEEDIKRPTVKGVVEIQKVERVKSDEEEESEELRHLDPEVRKTVKAIGKKRYG
jgi:hypothetical protein